MGAKGRTYHRWTPEEDKKLLLLLLDVKDTTILADRMGVIEKQIVARIKVFITKGFITRKNGDIILTPRGNSYLTTKEEVIPKEEPPQSPSSKVIDHFSKLPPPQPPPEHPVITYLRETRNSLDINNKLMHTIRGLLVEQNKTLDELLKIERQREARRKDA